MSQLHRTNSQMTEQAVLFDIDALGASFQHLAVDVIPGEVTEFTSHWYRSRNGEADLVVWMDEENRILKHQLCFYGQVVEWSPIYGTRTGVIVEEELAFGASTPGGMEVTERIRFDRIAQRGVVQQAIHLLSCMAELRESERRALIYNLRESPRLHKKARDRALKVWAPKVDEIHSNRRPTFWKRLKNWVLG